MTEREQLEQAIAALEAQRATLGNAVVDPAIAGLHKQLAALERSESFRPAPEGERKSVTIMFADISGFTVLAETMDPEVVRDMMNACFDRLVPVVAKYDGTVDKFIGDEIMALFGAPMAHENDPERALRAALEMMESLEQFNIERTLDLGMHIGINTGMVVTGGIGSEGRQEYSVMGDAVNLAARLEDASERGEILVGPDTYRLTAPLFEFEALQPIRVKGKAEPVATHRLSGIKTEADPRRGIKGLRSVMIGRGAELGQLQAALGALQEGKGSVITIVGEAGLGKSRLIAEARRASPAAITWAEGRALSYAQGMSYWIARDVLYSLLGVKADTPLEITSERLRNQVLLLAQRQSLVSEPQDVWPYLAHLLDLPLDKATVEQMAQFGPQALQKRIWQAFSSYVDARARGPLVLVWEDLHWADVSSLNLLESLLSLTDEIPLLFLLVFRPEKGPAWDFHRRVGETWAGRYRVLELHPLTRDHSAHLVQSLLKIEDLPDQTRALILDKAEGNPLFLEELLRSLIDAGMVLLQEDKAVAAETIHDLAALDVPDTLQGVIAARIDRLSPGDKYTLQTAAVIGRVFQRQVLQHMLDQGGVSAHLDTALDELQRHEFIRRREVEVSQVARTSSPESWEVLEYIFKHVLTQETAYNSLLVAQRKVLHRVAGEVIETLFSERLEELAATLAHHFEHAEIPDKAIAFLLRAGNRAARLSANEEAVAYLHQGLKLLQALPDSGSAEQRTERAQQEIALQIYLAVALQNLRGYGDTKVGQAFRRTYELCERIGETRRTASVATGLCGFHWMRAEYGPALEMAERLLSIASKMKSRFLRLASNTGIAAVLSLMGELDKGLKHAEQAIASYSPHLHSLTVQEGGANAGMLSLLHAALILQLSGLPDQSRKRLHEAIALAQDVAHPYSLASVLVYSALVSQLRRDVQTVQEYTVELVTLSTEYGFQVTLAFGIVLQGWTMAMQGRAPEGLAQVQRGLAMMQATGTEIWRSYFFSLLAEVHIHTGRLEEGLAALEDGIAFVERTGERFCEAEIHRLKGELLLKWDEVEVEACFQHAIEIARQQNARFWELRATMSLCRLWARRGQRERARQTLAEVYGWFTEGLDTPDLQEAQGLLKELLPGTA